MSLQIEGYGSRPCQLMTSKIFPLSFVLLNLESVEREKITKI